MQSDCSLSLSLSLSLWRDGSYAIAWIAMKLARRLVGSVYSARTCTASERSPVQ